RGRCARAATFESARRRGADAGQPTSLGDGRVRLGERRRLLPRCDKSPLGRRSCPSPPGSARPTRVRPATGLGGSPEYPEDEARVRPEAFGLLARAEAALALRHWSEAERLARDALALEPEGEAGHALLAVALTSQSRHEEAIATADKGIAASPRSEWLHRIR